MFFAKLLKWLNNGLKDHCSYADGEEFQNVHTYEAKNIISNDEKTAENRHFFAPCVSNVSLCVAFAHRGGGDDRRSLTRVVSHLPTPVRNRSKI